MSVEMRPLGVACNLACTYCYQEPMREAGNINRKYDVEKMLAEAEKTGQDFHLFGGEALLIPKKDIIKFFKRGKELAKERYKRQAEIYEKRVLVDKNYPKPQYRGNGIQTNGTLIDDDHIQIFKDYDVGVGVSIDGPNELNALREVRGKSGDLMATVDSTKLIMNNIEKLVRNNISTSVILTLHKLNATEEFLPRLLNFMRWLGDIGVKHGNIHVLEVDEHMPDQEVHVLTQKENIYAFKKIAQFLEENPDLHYNPFEDYKEAMIDQDFESLTCYFNRCDPMNTVAVYGIEGDGGLSNCGRTNKEGIDWYKADDIYYERYISLYNTPQKYDGCQGCRFFMLCSGGCVGEAKDGDFRNKTQNCAFMKSMLTFYEKKAEDKGITPWSKRLDRPQLEQMLLSEMIRGNSTNVGYLTRDAKRVTTRIVEVKGN